MQQKIRFVNFPDFLCAILIVSNTFTPLISQVWLLSTSPLSELLGVRRFCVILGGRLAQLPWRLSIGEMQFPIRFPSQCPPVPWDTLSSSSWDHSQPAGTPPFLPLPGLVAVVYIGIYNLFFSALCLSGCSSHLVHLRPVCVGLNKLFLLWSCR